MKSVQTMIARALGRLRAWWRPAIYVVLILARPSVLRKSRALQVARSRVTLKLAAEHGQLSLF
jgi:hypothetical protein